MRSIEILPGKIAPDVRSRDPQQSHLQDCRQIKAGAMIFSFILLLISFADPFAPSSTHVEINSMGLP